MIEIAHPYLRRAKGYQGERRKDKNGSRDCSCFQGLELLQPDAGQDLQAGCGRRDQVSGQGVPRTSAGRMAVFWECPQGHQSEGLEVCKRACHCV